jgi:hypothetical protein
LKRVDAPLTALFWLLALICLASAMACWPTRHDDTLIQLAMFALIAVVVNAFFMSNISGVFSRYHTRLGFFADIPGTGSELAVDRPADRKNSSLPPRMTRYFLQGCFGEKPEAGFN